MATIKQQTLSGVKWSAIEAISMQGIQFIIGLVLARLLSPSDFGLVGLLTVFINISQAFTDGGFSSALIRKKDKTHEDYSTAFFFNIAVGVLCYGILYCIAPYVAKFFERTELENLLRVLSLSIVFKSFALVQIAKLTSEIDFKTQTYAAATSALVSGCIGIFLATKGFGVWSLVWQNVTMAISQALLLSILTKWRPLLEFSKQSFLYLFSFGSKLVASNLLFTIYSQLTTILIGKFYSATDLGCYSRGQQFAHLPSSTFTNIMGKVTFPILSKLQDDDGNLVRIYRKYIRLTSLICAFGLILLASIAKPLIIFLLTDKWSDAIIYLQLFCFAMITDHMSRINLNLLQVKGRSDLYLKLEIIKRCSSILLMIIALPFGIIHLCISMIIYAQFALFINTYYTGKLFNLGYITQLKDFGKYFIVSLIVCIPAYIISSISHNSIMALLLSPTIAISLYYLFLRNDENMKDLITMGKQLLKKR